jgi:hypothetical protein
MRYSRLGAIAAVAATISSAATIASAVEVQRAFPSLTFTQPVDLQNAGDGTDRLFVVEQAGIIKVFDNDPGATSASVFLDIRPLVTSGGETGLLGLAFHPAYESNGRFFVYYTAGNPLRSVVARYTVDPSNSDLANPASAAILFEVLQPGSNHKGGQLAFGPDGYLYVALGDGGDATNGQDLTEILGSLLRIDVDSNPQNLAPDCSGGANFAIPQDNPFADGPGGVCDEIWASGLRNPWRFSFDRVGGALWLADVGQGAFEEVDIVQGGDNLGWSTMEGFACYNPPSACDQTGLTLPIWGYEHNGSGKSITGGYVYRAFDVPELRGRYVAADYVDGRIWALEYDGSTATAQLLLDTQLKPTTFGIAEDGVVFLVDRGGTIHRFVASPTIQLSLGRLEVRADGTKTAVLEWNPGQVATSRVDVYVEEPPDGSAFVRTQNEGPSPGTYKLKLSPAVLPGSEADIQICERNSLTRCSNVVHASW